MCIRDSNYIEQKILDVRRTVSQFSVLKKSVILSWEENLNLLSANMSKWNNQPYISRSALSPSSFINPYSYLHDIAVDLESTSWTEVLKGVMLEVSKQVFERVIKDSGLDRGPDGDGLVNIGVVVVFNKSGDDISKGILF